MTTTTTDAAGASPFTAAVTAAAQRAVSRSGCSSARARQLRWVAGELRAAAERGLLPAGGLDSAAVRQAYLGAADAGALRRRGTPGVPSTDATRRVRRDALALLVTAAGAAAPARTPIPVPAARPPAEGPALHTLYAALLLASARPGASDADVRAAALVCVVADTAPRPGALAALRLGDVTLDARPVTLHLTETAPGSRTTRTRLEALSAGGASCLARWLERREALVATKTGVHAVFVSIAGNHDGTGAARRPPGLALQPRGLARAYAAAARWANEELLGADGFPIPTTLTPLRGAALAHQDLRRRSSLPG